MVARSAAIAAMLVYTIPLAWASVENVGDMSRGDAHFLGENDGVVTPVFENIRIPYLPSGEPATAGWTPPWNCGYGQTYIDTDGDGYYDWWDEDDDCDGISDDAELFVGSNQLARDSDGDGIPDGLDLAPLTPELAVTIEIEEFINGDGYMDCCFVNNERWGDPYVSIADIALGEYGEVVAEFTNIPGYSLGNHRHDAAAYTTSLGSQTIDSFPQRLDDYPQSGFLDFPKIQLRLQIKDHDYFGYDDAYYDIDYASGAQTMALLNTDLLHHAIDTVNNDKFPDNVFNGMNDGDASSSALVRLQIRVETSKCGIEAVVRLNSGLSMVRPGDLKECRGIA